MAQVLKRNDQETLNWFINNNEKIPVYLDLLPINIFSNWSCYNDTTDAVWSDGEIIINPNTLCWHANYCISVKKKLQMLSIVEKVLMCNL